jgi:hypothetical protein
MKLILFIVVVVVVAGLAYFAGAKSRKGIVYVGPYSPEAYNAAQMIKDGGQGTPYTLEIINAGREILAKQKGAK